MEVLEQPEWQARADAHRRRTDAWTAPHLARRRAGEAHPVEDFLFTYYSHRPSRLAQWHPGAGVVLAGAADYGRDYTDTPGGATLDVAALMERRGTSVAWIADLLAATASRPAFHGCFGLHEWAMVYRTPRARHDSWPMRLAPGDIAAVVEERGVRCSHFDAFRFFTAPARPLNVLRPTRETQRDLEQPGCLHANMDLYKWAYKLSPLVPSELVADCFELARDIRLVDMRASPYDLAPLGHEPIRVETAEGRAEYAGLQRSFTERAAPLRARLHAACARLLPRPRSVGRMAHDP
ncbi:3-methyladenine DNA glycosylase [Actinomadura parmotrematis]|uniref:3-methyladenine DNA glycosylase n=1 Tax=Actinomadura parmotrematis TaxID=2864039 RepID=A0ABS7FRS6_9ACTN|nr:3-methyladenine DNA glycosylase [Actinomadura parmotrematis]MBW8483110.1 3-methyladenine DNA glycosylase [Actinomadura parmotrematis]